MCGVDARWPQGTKDMGTRFTKGKEGIGWNSRGLTYFLEGEEGEEVEGRRRTERMLYKKKQAVLSEF